MKKLNLSLLGLFAITTCVVIGASHVITSMQLARTKAELSVLRDRLDLIDVKDTQLIAARRLPTSQQFTNRWVIRIPTPEGKRVYANWGKGTLDELCAPNPIGRLRTFDIKPNTETHETFVEMRLVRNSNDPKWGSVIIELDGAASDMTVEPKIFSVLTGETANRVITVTDSPTARSPKSSLKLYSVESTSGPPIAFCLWIDDVRPSEGGATN